MHSFYTPWKYQGFLMFSGGKEMVHWEQTVLMKTSARYTNCFIF